jgi:hypothetical protein
MMSIQRIPQRVLSKALSTAAALFALVGANVAFADVIALSYSTTSSGTTGSGANTVLAVPGSHTFGNSLGSLTTSIFTTPGGQSYEFYDDFVFTIGGATANALTSSIDLGSFLGLQDFQVRLYALAGNEPLPALGAPAGGTLVQAWSAPIGFTPGMTGLLAVIPQHVLAAGSYVLEIRGNVSGQFGGSYSGVMNLAPVPVPAAIWLLISGLGALGLWRRSR